MAQTQTGRGARTHRRPCGRVVLLAALLSLAPAGVQAQQFALPVDVEQGLVFGAPGPHTPYLFALRVAPSIDVGRLRFGVVLGPAYRNPEWDFALGANVGWLVPVSGKHVGVRFMVQGEYLPNQQAGRVSVGIVGDLLGLLRIGLWPAFNIQAMRAELCVGIGGDIMRWAKLVSNDL